MFSVLGREILSDRRTAGVVAGLKVDGMQSWPAAPLPALPGRGPELRLYDSSDRQVRPVAAGPTATMYVCGITPYDATHLGHAATYLAFDLIHRIWRTSAMTCTTCRTSPTSTIHCSSGPTATASTGASWPPARSRCIARTWPRCGCCRRGNTWRQPTRWPRSSSWWRRCWPPGPPTSSTTPNSPTCTSAPTRPRSSATNRAMTATPC